VSAAPTRSALDAATHPSSWLVPAASRPERPRVVAVGGDGIGPEIVKAAVACLRAVGAELEIREPLHGEPAERELGTAFPDDLKRELAEADAILFGAVDTGPKGHCRGILRHIRWGMDTYANLRPAVKLPGLPSGTATKPTNLVIVRELSEGLYPGREGDIAELGRRWPEQQDSMGRRLPADGRFAIRVVTEQATRRIARVAGRLAAHRKATGAGRGVVAVVTKSNVLRHTDGWFHALCVEELERLGVAHEEIYVDEAARRLVAVPDTFDVIVTSNLFGDILSDVASEIMGGMPMAPSAGLGDGVAYFESCHGSAPDIAGKGLANPSATILSAGMMLAYLGQDAAAGRLVEAVLATIGDGTRTRDLGGSASTAAFTEAVCRRLA
jgi:isocitrate/isopropylmalate dehydrogenase